jgi:hypothetical protein
MIPNIVLAVLLSFSVIVFMLFYLGGNVDQSEALIADLSQPVYTDLLMKYMYVLFGIALVAAIYSAVSAFATKFAANPQKALFAFVGVGSLALLMTLTYALGDTTPLNIIGFDGEQTAFALRISDMSLYSIYILFGIVLVVSGLSFLSKRFS